MELTGLGYNTFPMLKMNHDEKLCYLILLWRRDDKKPPELVSFISNQYNPLNSSKFLAHQVMLIDEKYVYGDIKQDTISGNVNTCGMGALTKFGIEWLEKLECKYGAANQEPDMALNSNIRIFISHSAKDEKLAEALITLIQKALNIPDDEVRCTSVAGHCLKAGAHTEEQLKKEVKAATICIGLITPHSIESAYVLFELGARWGANLPFIPLLGAGADTKFLRGPLGGMNALKCDEPASLQQLVVDLADYLNIHKQLNPAGYQRSIDELVKVSKKEYKPVTPVALTTRSGVLDNFFGGPEPIEKIGPKTPAKNNNPAIVFAGGGEPSNKPLPAELSLIEVNILKLFAQTTNNSALVGELIIERLGVHHLFGDKCLENLERRNFIKSTQQHGVPGFYRLTSLGRDYLIENNMLQN